MFKGSRAGYDVDAFSTSAIELDCSTKKLFLSLSLPNLHHTVIATLGPACRDVETLKDMLEAGMSCARVDLTVRKKKRDRERH